MNYHDDTVISDDENENYSPTNDVASPIDLAETEESDKEKSTENDEEAQAKAKDRFVEYGFQLPPEPKGKCPADLQEKISNMYEKMKVNHMDMNKLIQERKEFRNPSIYEKLIQFCEIDELGTNYPPELYDPMQWTSMSAVYALPQHNETDKITNFAFYPFRFVPFHRKRIFLLWRVGQSSKSRDG